MNGIEKITARIIANAEAEATDVKAEAAAKCELIREEYDKKSQDEYWRIVKSGVKDCEARVQRLGRAAEMEAKKSILSLKQDMVSDAFTKSVEQVRAMPQEQYIDFLARLASKSSCSGTEEIIVSERDAGIGNEVAQCANKLMNGRGTLKFSGKVRDILGGVILSDGDIEINCSIEAQASQYRYELASQVAEIIFG